MNVPNYCKPCGETLLPEQTECPFCGQMAVPVDALAGEAGTAATVKQGAVHEHATAQPERPNSMAILPNKERPR